MNLKLIWKLCILAIALVTLFSYSYADTIVSVADSVNTNNRPDYFIGGQFSNVVVASWTQTRSFSNVTIDAELVSTDANFLTGTAYLMTAIGPGTTPASEILPPITFTAQLGPVGNSGPSLPTTILFSGLELKRGTYYLVITAPSATTTLSPLVWQIPTSYDVTESNFAMLGNGFAANSSISPLNPFPPANQFISVAPAMFDVTGTLVPTPEPSNVLLLSTGLLGIVGAARRKLRR